jgi:hypothetical protein
VQAEARAVELAQQRQQLLAAQHRAAAATALAAARLAGAEGERPRAAQLALLLDEQRVQRAAGVGGALPRAAGRQQLRERAVERARPAARCEGVGRLEQRAARGYGEARGRRARAGARARVRGG